jgi:hypothetical protein
MREFARVHLVGAPRDGNGTDRGQIRLADCPCRVYGFATRFSGAVVVGAGWYDLR